MTTAFRGKDDMTYEAAFDFAERWVGRWNAHDVDGILDLVAGDVSWQDPSLDGTAHGRAAARDYIANIFRAFPDIAWSMPHPLYLAPDANDGVIRIAQYWTCHGTLSGTLDPPGFAPTGKPFELDGVDLWELNTGDGLLRRVVSHYDAMELARRIDLMPPRGGRAELALVRLQRVRERLRR